MGYFRSGKIPEYNPFWEDEEHQEHQPEHWFWYHLGYDDGHRDGAYRAGLTTEEIEKVVLENESLKALLDANVRVIKEDLKKEYGLTEFPEQKLQTLGDSPTDGRADESLPKILDPIPSR